MRVGSLVRRRGRWLPVLARTIAGTAACMMMCSVGVAIAQTVDEALWVTSGDVYSVARDGGTIYIGGSFSLVGPATGCAVALDAGNALAQQPFPRVAGRVFAVAPDGAGGWYLGGLFSAVRGQPRHNLAHIDAAGNVVDWSPNAANY